MKSALWPLQVSIFNRLKNDTALSSKAKVFDSVSESAPMPYVVIGEDTVIPFGTKIEEGEEITHTLYVYSSYNGRKEVKELMSLVLESITREPLSLGSGFSMFASSLDLMQVTEINGSPAKRGVMRFRFKITQ